MLQKKACRSDQNFSGGEKNKKGQYVHERYKNFPRSIWNKKTF